MTARLSWRLCHLILMVGPADRQSHALAGWSLRRDDGGGSVVVAERLAPFIEIVRPINRTARPGPEEVASLLRLLSIILVFCRSFAARMEQSSSRAYTIMIACSCAAPVSDSVAVLCSLALTAE